MAFETTALETATDVESAGLLSVEEEQEKSRPVRALAAVLGTSALLAAFASSVHAQHQHSSPASAGSSTLSAWDEDIGVHNYACDAGLANAAIGWSDEKKEWCCANFHKGCGLSEAFDCEAGFWNWQNGWSEEKKQV